MDKNAVSPTLIDSCLENWRGKEAQELSALLLESMKSTSRPRKTPRDRLKINPGAIPLSSLLSRHYLNVPSADNGQTVFGLTQRERHHRLNLEGPNVLEQPPERSLMSFIIE